MQLAGPRVLRDGTAVGGPDYDQAEVLAALRTHRYETFRYEQHRIVAGNWVVLDDITRLIQDATITLDDKATNYTESASISLRDPDNLLNVINDAVRCFHQIRMPDGNFREWDKGTFYVNNPQMGLNPSRLWAITAQDALRNLFDAKLEDVFQVPSDAAGAFEDGDPIGWATKLIADRFPLAGIDLGGDTEIRVPSAAPKIYKAGTNILTIVNDLLAYCNRDHLTANVTGSYISKPWRALSGRDVDFEYFADGDSVLIRDSATAQQDFWNAFNYWKRTVSHPGLPVLTSQLKIVDASNPLSPDYRGYGQPRLVLDDDVVDAPDQTTLNEMLERLFEEGQGALKKVTLETPLMPHDAQDKVTLTWPTQDWAAAGNGTFILRGWTFPMQAGGRMQHQYEAAPFNGILVERPYRKRFLLSRFVPMVATTANVIATPGVQTLTTSTFAPSATISNIVEPGVATLTLTTFAPGLGDAMVKISEVVLGSDQATIDFSSIPSTYSHLLLVISGRLTRAVTNDSVYLTFNGDTSSIYDYHYYDSYSTTQFISGSDSNAKAFIANMAAANAPSGAADAIVVQIPNYKRTDFNKSFLVDSQTRANTTNANFHRHMLAGWWNSTAAINQITLSLDTGNFKAGTVATLYGLE